MQSALASVLLLALVSAGGGYGLAPARGPGVVYGPGPAHALGGTYGHAQGNYGHGRGNYGHAHGNYGHGHGNYGHGRGNYGHEHGNYGHGHGGYGLAPGYGHGGYGHGHDYAEPRPYHFEYAVDDPHYGPQFSQTEDSDARKVQGYYSVKLPDGRTQHVRYYADQYGYGGYNAEVTYSGYAQHPPSHPAPYP